MKDRMIWMGFWWLMGGVLGGCLEKVERVCKTNENCALTIHPTVCWARRCVPKICQVDELRRCFGAEETKRGKGLCADGFQICIANGSAWSGCFGQTLPTEEICDGLDNNCDGQTDEGLDCACQSGQRRACYDGPKEAIHPSSICQKGIQTCTQNKRWGACLQQILPAMRFKQDLSELRDPQAIARQLYLCVDQDKNCDGQIDTDLPCLCQEGESRSCYLGPKGTLKSVHDPLDPRPCREGVQKCVFDHAKKIWHWGFCEGQILPRPEENPTGSGESCNGIDDDCDGKIDNQSKTHTPLWRRCPEQPTSCKIQICEGLAWSLCVERELCGNQVDDDCDGQIDEADCQGG